MVLHNSHRFTALTLVSALSQFAMAADPPTAVPTAVPTVIPTSAPIKRPDFVGETIQLQQDGKTFNALYTEAKPGKNRGAVLLLPDFNSSADARILMAPLRTQLPRTGWATLSLDMPQTTATSLATAVPLWLTDASKRLQAAMEFLSSKNVQTIILVGHGIGAVVATKYLATTPDPKVVGLAAIGLYSPLGLEPALDLSADLSKLPVPMLDLYGGRDLKLVRLSADLRQDAVRKGGKSYTRVEIKDARHDFNGLEAYLINRVRGWMDRITAQSNASPQN